jgi:hypothetical protein
MKWFNLFRDRLRALRQRDDVINDIDREMRAHVELQLKKTSRRACRLMWRANGRCAVLAT